MSTADSAMTVRSVLVKTLLVGCWFAALAASSRSFAGPVQPVSSDADARPDFAVIEQAVLNYFASQPDYKPGDLVTQKQVDEALLRVEEAGWEVPERDEVVDRALGESSFLVRELSKPAGRKFMRKIAQPKGAYVRLDRLSTISRGEEVVRQLIREKGGYEMIEYMATTKGGHNLGRMMAGAQQG